MIASLPMYARPDNRGAHDALWRGIRDGLRARDVAAPDTLNHNTAYDAVWARPDMVLGQICNLPYRALYRNKMTVIGASDYGLPGSQAGYYHSVYVVRAGDAARDITACDGYTFAMNDPLSQSGWGAAHADMTGRGVTPRPHLITGAHTDSLAAVAQGRADLASIDAQCLWMDRDTPAARACRVIGRTPSSPGQSFVTSGDVDPTPYFDAITQAIAGLPAQHRATLGLRGIVALPPAAYDLPIPPLAPVARFVAA